MPIVDDRPEKKGVKKLPRPKREFQLNDLVYRKQIDVLRKKGKQHSDIHIIRTVIDMLHKLIPVAEENYQEFPFHTNAAAVNHLLNQLRETINDQRSLEDFGKRGEVIADYVGSQYRKVLQQIVIDLFTVQKQSQAGNLSAKDFDNLRKTIANRFSASEDASRAHITQLLHVSR